MGAFAEIGKWKEIIGREEFTDAWKIGSVDWNSKEGILEGKIGGFHEMDNRELEENK